jgi:hypothetical protein
MDQKAAKQSVDSCPTLAMMKQQRVTRAWETLPAEHSTLECNFSDENAN